jgi:hypothetical protein
MHRVISHHFCEAACWQQPHFELTGTLGQNDAKLSDVSGACLIRGSSVLYEPLNAVEGYTPPGPRLCRCTEEPCKVTRCSNIRLLTLRCDRNLFGNGPQEPNQLSGNGHHDLVGMFAAGDESSLAFAQPDLSLPADLLDNFRGKVVTP